jgi:ABC-2 type transport system permease protein
MAAICWALVRASVRSEMQYRLNFLVEVLFGFVWHSLGFAFVLIVLGRFEAMGAWSLGDVALLYGIALCGTGIFNMVFSRVMMLDIIVRQGDWDRMLIRPVPTVLQMMFDQFRVAVFGDMLSGLVALGVGIALADIAWTPGKVLYLIAAVVGSACLNAAFQIGPGSLSFRFLDSESIRGTFSYVFTQFAGYPLGILQRRARDVLTFVIPMAFIAWVPGAVLLDRTAELPMPAWVAWCSPLLGPVLLGIAFRLFISESRQYQSSGT